MGVVHRKAGRHKRKRSHVWHGYAVVARLQRFGLHSLHGQLLFQSGPLQGPVRTRHHGLWNCQGESERSPEGRAKEKIGQRTTCGMETECHHNETAETGRVEQATDAAVHKPKVIIDYNKYMGGVDHSDQLTQYHSLTGRQSFIRRYYSISSILVIPAPRAVGRAANNAHDIARLTGRHFPSTIPPTPGSRKPAPTQWCKVCLNTGRRKDTRFQCEVCSTTLCVAPCFQRFHIVQNY